LSILSDGNGAKTYPELDNDVKRARENYIKLYGKYFKDTEKKLEFYLEKLGMLEYNLQSLKALYKDIKTTRNSEFSQLSLDEILTFIYKAIESNVTIPSNEIFLEEKIETPGIFMVGKHGLERVLRT